ncbi:alpha/beta fold hydrolase [Nocardia sp. NPDC004278]
MPISQQTFDASAPGVHAFDSDGVPQRYHVYGGGPVCLAHPGGPGFRWEYLRMPELEEHLTMVYVEPLGTGESGRLPTHPNGYTRERYSIALQRIPDSRLAILEHSGHLGHLEDPERFTNAVGNFLLSTQFRPSASDGNPERHTR